jgi:hypothetical protein
MSENESDRFYPSGQTFPMMGDFVSDIRNPIRTGVVAITKTFSVVWSNGDHEFWPTNDGPKHVLPGPTPVCHLKLCEASRLALKPDTLYWFTVDGNCAECRQAAATAKV